MSPTWLTVARKDVDDAIRSRTLLALVVILTLLEVLVFALPGFLAEGFPVEGAVWLITVPASIVAPLVALVASYLAIAGERESGSLKILLGLPPSRGDVVLGKFVGRAVVVELAIVASFAVGALVVLVSFGELPVGPYVLMAALTALLALSFVGLAVGFSTSATSRSRAMAPAIGLYVVLVGLWDLFVTALPIAADWLFSIQLSGETVDLVTVLSPVKAYGRLINSLLIPWLRETLPSGINAGLPSMAPSGGPIYLQDPFVVGLLVAWTVIPLALGYWRFAGADLT